MTTEPPADAPTTGDSTDDITELVLADHHRLRLMFLRLEDVRDDDAELGRQWQELADLLELHASAEEETFYPRLLAEGAGEAQDETEDAIGDHDEIRDAVRRAADAEVGSDAWWSAVRDARQENSTHLHEEETGALPDFRANSTAAERAELARAWQQFRSEHPHARGLSGKDKDPDEYIEANT